MTRSARRRGRLHTWWWRYTLPLDYEQWLWKADLTDPRERLLHRPWWAPGRFVIAVTRWWGRA